jgi:CO/xanthine dehydrogenase FAD-binding subunit
MQEITYLAPTSLGDVYEALADGKKSVLLAGGTDIIIQLREGRSDAEQVIDLKHIPELTQFAFNSAGDLEIGAAVPFAEIYENAEVIERFPALIDCATLVGGVQIQSRAGFGGNLCNASPAADTSPALIALSAILRIGSANTVRELAVEEFFLSPGQNALEKGEVLLQVVIPNAGTNSGAYFHRFIPRNEMDIAVANVGVSLSLNNAGDLIEDARVAIGAVAPTPLLVSAAAEALIGKEPNAETFSAAGDAAAAAAKPITDMRGSAAQRVHLSRVLTVRALERALERSKGN